MSAQSPWALLHKSSCSFIANHDLQQIAKVHFKEEVQGHHCHCEQATKRMNIQQEIKEDYKGSGVKKSPQQQKQQ